MSSSLPARFQSCITWRGDWISATQLMSCRPSSSSVARDRIDHHLADVEPSGLDHGRARQERLPARHAAPHVDALVGRAAPRRERAAGGSPNGCRRSRSPQRRAPEQARALSASAKWTVTPASSCSTPTHRWSITIASAPSRSRTASASTSVQLAAMDRELRPFVAGEAAARFGEDELAVPGVVAHLARLDRVHRQAHR